jgi:1-aminocyclopropane-1-carboxylate deaminase
MKWINEFITNSRTERFNYSLLNDLNCDLFIKRDDLIHSEISGNKIRKLLYNLKFCTDNNIHGIVTYGGAFSNHLLATASAANLSGIHAIGRVRGDELNEHSNELLQRCHELGMKLEFVDRGAFSSQKHFSGILEIEGKPYLSIPEGGANELGVLGCKELIHKLPYEFDYYCLAQGTTTTSIGLALSLPENSKLIVVPVLKGFDSKKEMKSIIGINKFNIINHKIIVLDDFHFGGYAKVTEELKGFISEFNCQNDFDIEPVYTGKAMYALVQYLITNNIRNKKVLFVHTGGLSNWKSKTII